MDDDIQLEEEDLMGGETAAGVDDDAADAGAIDDDIDTPVDHALLYGDNDDQGDAEALAAVAGSADDNGDDGGAEDKDDGDVAANQQGSSDARGAAADVAKQPEIPSERVAQVITQIRDMHTRLGLPEPDFGDAAVAMSSEDFSELVTLRNRMKIKVAASSIDLDEPQGKAADANAAADEKQQPQPIDLDEKEREYLDAQYNGDTERAMQIRREIRAEELRLSEEAASRKALEVASSQKSKDDVNAVAKDAIKAYPFLNENDGNNAAMNEVVEWRDFYASKGQSPAQALASAVGKVAPLYDKKTPTPTGEGKTDRRVTEDPRKAAAIARNAADAAAQPPMLDVGVGTRATPVLPDVESQEDWEKLPEAERKRLMM